MTPVLDRTTQAFIDRLAAEDGKPIYLLTPEEEAQQPVRATVWVFGSES
jgi:hypothetical protein